MPAAESTQSRQRRSHTPESRSRRSAFSLFRCFSVSAIDELPRVSQGIGPPPASRRPSYLTDEAPARSSHRHRHVLQSRDGPLATAQVVPVRGDRALRMTDNATAGSNMLEGRYSPDQTTSVVLPVQTGPSPERAAALVPIDQAPTQIADDSLAFSSEVAPEDDRRDSEWLSSDGRTSPVSARLLDVILNSDYLLADPVQGAGKTPALTPDMSPSPSANVSTSESEVGEQLTTPVMTLVYDHDDRAFRPVSPFDDLPQPAILPTPPARVDPLPILPGDRTYHAAHLIIANTTTPTRPPSLGMMSVPREEEQAVVMPPVTESERDVEALFTRETLSRSVGRAALEALFLPPNEDQNDNSASEAGPIIQDASSPSANYGSTTMTSAPTLDTIDIPTPEMDMPETMTSPQMQFDETTESESPDLTRSSTWKLEDREQQGILPGPSVRFPWAKDIDSLQERREGGTSSDRDGCA